MESSFSTGWQLLLGHKPNWASQWATVSQTAYITEGGFLFHPRIQEVCESRSGRPGLPVLMSLVVSVDVKQHWTMLTHWSQFVPNMSTRHQRTWNSTSSSSSFQPLRSHFNPKEVTPCSWPKTIRHFLLFCPTMNQFTQCSPWVFHPWVKSFRPGPWHSFPRPLCNLPEQTDAKK